MDFQPPGSASPGNPNGLERQPDVKFERYLCVAAHESAHICDFQGKQVVSAGLGTSMSSMFLLNKQIWN